MVYCLKGICYSHSNIFVHLINTVTKHELYTQYQLQNGKVRYADIKIIPLNSEKNLHIRIGNVLFLDSFQFIL